MEIAEGCQHELWLESWSLTKKGERPQKRQSSSFNHFEIKYCLGSAAPSNSYSSLQMSRPGLAGTDSDQGHLPSSLLHSCTVFECPSTGQRVGAQSSSTTCLIPLSPLDGCSLHPVHGSLQVTGSPFLDTVLCSSHPAVSQSSLVMCWDSGDLRFPGCCFLREGRKCTQEQDASHWNRQCLSRETHDRGLTAKPHGPPPFCCTLTPGLNSQNTLKKQSYVWPLSPPLCKPHTWPLHLAEGACPLSLSLAHWKVEWAITSCCKLSHLFTEVTFNTHYRSSVYTDLASDQNNTAGLSVSWKHFNELNSPLWTSQKSSLPSTERK